MKENILGFRALARGDRETAEKHLLRSLQHDATSLHANFNLACTRALMEKPFNENKTYLDALLARPEHRRRYLSKIKTDPDLDFWRKEPAFAQWLQEAEELPMRRPPPWWLRATDREGKTALDLASSPSATYALQSAMLSMYFRREFESRPISKCYPVQFSADVDQGRIQREDSWMDLTDSCGAQARSAARVTARAFPKVRGRISYPFGT